MDYCSAARIDLCELAPQGILEEDSLAAVTRVVEAALANPLVHTLCLTGSEETFLHGADRRQFARWTAADDLQALMEFTQRANALLTRIARSPKRTVAWIEGIAAGAGLELALSCKEIIAGPRARFRLPETALGIYPGMGGTQRLPRRLGKGLAKMMIYTGAIVPADAAWPIGLVDRRVDAGTTLEQLLGQPVRQEKAPARAEKWQLLEPFFNTYTIEQLLDERFPAPGDGVLQRARCDLLRMPASALLAAERAIDGGFRLPLEDGLALEMAGLPDIFRTPEARQRLAAE
ncbi:enoyl-CoA hydratase/isomerase family protein [Lignipirellula cremea]|uniref:enoyl-CoA hydratase/isomerase family protein n=1 Tax=Lignipirellula cremea TaxID=2528010 RepID=UPI0018D24D3E|nr:enoyl-CoA hydratase/isomerase family protein [Lignipirellula cremea]